jgi:hypothetical protein
MELFFFFVVLGFELRAMCFLGQCSTFEPLYQFFFVMGIFKIGSHELFTQGWF